MAGSRLCDAIAGLRKGGPWYCEWEGRCLWVSLSVNACCLCGRKSWGHLLQEIPFLLSWYQLSQPPHLAWVAHVPMAACGMAWTRWVCGRWFPCRLVRRAEGGYYHDGIRFLSGKAYGFGFFYLFIWILLFMVMLPSDTTYLTQFGLTPAACCQNGYQ